MKSGLLISSALALVILAACTKDAVTEPSYTIRFSDKATQESLMPLIKNLSSLDVQDSVTVIVNADKETLCQSLNQACSDLGERDVLAQWAVVAYPSEYTGEMEDQEPTFEWINGGDSPSPSPESGMRSNFYGTKTFMNHTVRMCSSEIYPINDDDGRIATYDMAPERVRAIYSASTWPFHSGNSRLFIRGCQTSDELNKGCGWRTKNIYLGVLTDNAKRRDGSGDLKEIGDITGLKLMASNTESRPETVQKDGITWHICPAYEGSQDLNKWAGGSYLYLYYTTDYTGMQFYLAPAKALEYSTNDPFSRSVYGALCTWITDTAIKTQDFNSKDGLNINPDNVYFIPLVDKNFDPDCSDYPANFNHNTKGKVVYLSLPYVKVSK